MTQRIEIRLSEWSSSGAMHAPEELLKELASSEAGLIFDRLGDRLRVEPGFRGLEVNSTSYVGRIDIGPLRVSINPKIDGLPLSDLLKYAYGVDDLWVLEHSSVVEVADEGIQDLFVELLVDQVDALRISGLTKQYLLRRDSVDVIRGRIDANALARRGLLTDARVPCLFYERTANWHLNRVLRTGLELATSIATTPRLRRRVERLISALEQIEALRALTILDIERAERSLTRLSERAAPALNLIRLLLDGRGLGFEDSEGVEGRSFLFDMNRFFQRFLSRFLHDHVISHRLADESTIHDLYRIRASDAAGRRRRAPKPRPDFALFGSSGTLTMYMDAKYRDLWNTTLPPEWVYQLSAYALACPARTCVLLYATTHDQAREEIVEVHDPVSRIRLANVIVRPVPMGRIGALLRRKHAAGHAERSEIAHALISGSTAARRSEAVAKAA
jgi:5-methylcytosine-specific restriction enzyme subunit McrC